MRNLNNTKKLISYYQEGVKQKNPSANVGLIDIYEMVKGDEFKAKIENIRSKSTKDERTPLKLQLPLFTASGSFKDARKKDNLIQHSGVIGVDLDHIDVLIKDTLSGDSFINPSLIFISPSGDGLKLFINVKGLDENNHLDCFRALESYFFATYKLEIDRACKDISRPCYLSHDDSAYYCEDGTVEVSDLLGYAPNIEHVITPDIYNKPSDELNKNSLIISRSESCLKSAGWKQSKELWTRPNKKSGFSAKYNFSSKDGFPIFTNFSDGDSIFQSKAYSPVQIICLLDFNDDWKECISELSKEYLPKLKPTVKTEHAQISEYDKYFRVGSTHYKKIYKVDKFGVSKESHIILQRQTLVDDHGKGILSDIKKFDSWCNVPDNIDYKEVIRGNKNLYSKISNVPVEGKCETILGLLNHIFGDQIELGLDYMQLMYLNPIQLLPVLCLVSEENQTGKTTFGNLLGCMFESNACILGKSELDTQFNSSYASKLAIVFDESKVEAKAMDKLKALATAQTIQLRRMHTDHQSLDFFGKIILLSNHTKDFISATKHDQRFWVRRLKPFGKYDPKFDDNIKREVPHFLYLLSKRTLSTKKDSRMWFNAQNLITEDLIAVQENSHTWLYKELSDYLLEMMDNEGTTKIECTTKDLKNEFFKNNSKYGTSDIKKVLQDEMGLISSTVKRYRFHKEIGETKTGRIYTILKDDLKI